MSAQKFITEHLDIWTGAITKKSSSGRGSNGKIELAGIKKLRELILELAVRGKLAEQDPTDEPAEELLVRVYKENEASSSKKKRTSEFTTIDAPRPYSVPHAWTWAHLGNLFDIVYGRGLPKSKLTDEGYEVFGANGIIGKYTEFTYEHPQLLISCRGAYSGKANISPAQCFITSNTLILKNSWSYLNLQYFYYALTVADKSKIVTGSAQPQVTTANLSPFMVAVPPLEEQHRIVQKVDELMALCDRLEQQTHDQLEAHETLVDTLLGTLTQSEDTTELADNWARLAAHFDTLFTTEQSIDKLKQTILQLAVMGRLVEQNLDDDPAATLIQSIENQKREFIKSGAIKRSKPLPPVSQEDHPFRLPNGWRCHRLGELVTKLGSGSTPRGGQRAYVDDGVPFLRSQNVWNEGLRLDDIVYISEDTHTRMSNTVVYPGDILLNITGASLGRSTIFPNHIPEANVSQHVTIIRLIEPAMTSFVHLCIQSPLIQSLVWGRQVGMAIEGLSKKVLERFEMPVPPLEEQKRIVQKINELMTLCDKLRERVTQANATRCTLAEALTKQALN